MKKLIIFIFLFFNTLYLACKKEPGSIWVEFVVEPSTVTSGEKHFSSLIVTNMGKKQSKFIVK